ncbi:MAG: hypothetical protein ACXVHZ_13200, partial [Acidimicrobiia bacterium]
MELRLGVGRGEERAERGLPPRPVGLAEVVEPGAGPGRGEELVRVESDEQRRVPDRVAEQVQAPDPIRMFGHQRGNPAVGDIESSFGRWLVERKKRPTDRPSGGGPLSARTDPEAPSKQTLDEIVANRTAAKLPAAPVFRRE